jgi:prophage tail gpP-like protein
LSSGIVEVGESSKGVDPKESVVVYPRVVEVSRSCFCTMGVSFVGSDQKGFLDFLTLLEDERFNSDSSPKKDNEIKRKKGKREVKNLECSINFDAKGVGSSRVRGKKLGV